MTVDEILELRAQRLARPLAAAAAGEPALLAVIGTQTYAFLLADVRRASVIRSITRVPHLPPIVLGLGRLEGDVVAVFDGNVWAGGKPRSSTDHMPVLVLGPAATPLVLAVDALPGSTMLPTTTQPVTADGTVVVHVGALLADPAFSLAGDRT